MWMIEVVTVLRYFYSTEPEVALELPDDTLGTKILTQWQNKNYVFFKWNQIIILHVNVGNNDDIWFVKTRSKFSH
jgi:hypothetical protein